MQYLILLRAVDTDVFGSAKIANLRIESSQFRHLDEGTEPLFLNDVVRDGELVICGFLGKDGCPCVKAVDTLLSKACGRRYLNRRYNSVRLFEMVVPERKVAPKSLPDLSCMVRIAKSMFKARCEPSGLPKPDTRRGVC